jgi:hypothetical protein
LKDILNARHWFSSISVIDEFGSLNDEHSNHIWTILEIQMNQDNKGQPQQGGQSNKPGQQGQQPGQNPGQQTQQPNQKSGEGTKKN